MRILFIATALIFPVIVTAQQTKEYFYLYDSAWNSCKAENAKYMAFVKEVNDTTYRWNYYNYTGPIITVETYRDKDAKIPNGFFAWYDSNGIIDSSGYTVNGKKSGNWYTYSDTLSVIAGQKWKEGKLIRMIDYTDGYKTTDDPNDSLRGDVAAHFEGGINGWLQYLQKNHQFPLRAHSLSRYGKVIVDFIVDSTGKVTVAKLSRSVEFSIDQEAIRVISNSPGWTPAIHNGKKVNAYRRQSINFGKRQ